MVYKCAMKAGQEHKCCVGVGIGLVLSFATDSYFRHWKALKLLKFDSGLQARCVLLPVREERKKTFLKGNVYWAPVCAEALQRMGKGGLTLSRHSTGLFDSLESSDHWPGTIPHSLLHKHPSQASLPWIALDVDGFPKAVTSLKPQERNWWQHWFMAWLCRGRGGYRALHLELCHLNPLFAFDILAFRRPHEKPVMEQWIKPPSWLKMHFAAPTPQSAASSSVHCSWENLYCKIYKRQLRCLSLFS